MSNIKYIEKDLFEGIKDHKDCVIFIPHITNNIKKWGAGFVLPLAKHFPEARRAFFSLNNPKLGEVQFVSCDPLLVDIEKKYFVICNMFAQDGIYSTHNTKPIRYDSLKDCMLKIAYYINDLQEKSKEKVVISAPMFGSGLAGGDWQIIEKMIKEIWSSIDVIVYFTKLPKGYEKRQINSETLILKV